MYMLLTSIALLGGIGASDGASQEQTPTAKKPAEVRVRILRSDPVTFVNDDGEDAKLTLIEVVLPPLASSPPHFHPGPVSGVVVGGILEFQVGERKKVTLKAGETFFEPAMTLHKVARNPDPTTTCRIIVTMLHPASAKRLTIPADTSSDGRASSAKSSSETDRPQQLKKDNPGVTDHQP